MLKCFVAIPCGSKSKLFVLMSRFKICAWFATALPTAVLAAGLLVLKHLLLNLEVFVNLPHLVLQEGSRQELLETSSMKSPSHPIVPSRFG